MRTPLDRFVRNCRIGAALSALALLAVVAHAAFPAFIATPDTPGIVADVVGDDLVIHCRNAAGQDSGGVLKLHYDGAAVYVVLTAGPANSASCPVYRNGAGEPNVYDVGSNHLNP